jgi:hypothetical protein
MTANVVPFRKSLGRGPRSWASGREACESLPAATLQQEEAMREARRKLAECWELRAESRRIQRDYEERKLKIEALLDRLERVP